MSESDVNAILLRLSVMEATMTGKLDSLASENLKAEALHTDHEQRIRSLERVRWAAVGVALMLGGGSGAALSKILGGS